MSTLRERLRKSGPAIDSSSVQVLEENQDFLILIKPFGMPSQSDDSGDQSAVEWAEAHLHTKVHLLHRLDRPTGGLLALAKTQAAAKYLGNLFEARAMEKTYLGVTANAVEFEQAEWHHYIAKLPQKNFVRAYRKQVRFSKPAILAAKVLQRHQELTLLELNPATGRRHQIRAQLKEAGLSLLGDFKYGKKVQPVPYPGIALWAHRLAFTDSAGRSRCFVAPLPQIYPWQLFQ